MLALARIARRRVQAHSIARRPLSTGTSNCEVFSRSARIEEENWEWYSTKEFYNVRIGQVLKSRYRVLGKLGYGAYATTWLCRDLVKDNHVALKVAPRHAIDNELKVLQHISTIKTEHAGALLVRQLLDSFEIDSSDGAFLCTVHPPLAISLKAFRQIDPDAAFPPVLLKLILVHLFLSLDFPHTEAGIIHTDIQEHNILLGLNDATAKDDLLQFERDESASPSARKIDPDGAREVYLSRPLVPPQYSYGRPVLCDFGEARFTKDYDARADIQPYKYRAPEVILGVPWDEKVDIWAVGAMTWDLLGNGNLFPLSGKNPESVYHVARMVALLGPPPKDFLERALKDQAKKWFDEHGNWTGTVEIPRLTLEESETMLPPEERDLFFGFARKMLAWRPEDRSSAEEMLQDPWLNTLHNDSEDTT